MVKKAPLPSPETVPTDEESASAAIPSLVPCGLVMPISECDGCPEFHWKEVRSIIEESLSETFNCIMVSESDSIGIIQKRIVQNLYNLPLVVCDISGKNPNVMLEVGMRLAFDKATIVIKDDKTGFSFDTSPIEHLVYPRDLRFSKIVAFQEELGRKARSTHRASIDDPEYSTFLKSFGDFTVPKLKTKEIDAEEYFLEVMKEISSKVDKLARDRPEATFLSDQGDKEAGDNDPFESLLPFMVRFVERNIRNGVTFVDIQERRDLLHEAFEQAKSMGKRVTIAQAMTVYDRAIHLVVKDATGLPLHTYPRVP